MPLTFNGVRALVTAIDAFTSDTRELHRPSVPGRTRGVSILIPTVHRRLGRIEPQAHNEVWGRNLGNDIRLRALALDDLTNRSKRSTWRVEFEGVLVRFRQRVPPHEPASAARRPVRRQPGPRDALRALLQDEGDRAFAVAVVEVRARSNVDSTSCALCHRPRRCDWGDTECITGRQATDALREAVIARGWDVQTAEGTLNSDSLGEAPPLDTYLGTFLHNVYGHAQGDPRERGRGGHRTGREHVLRSHRAARVRPRTDRGVVRQIDERLRWTRCWRCWVPASLGSSRSSSPGWWCGTLASAWPAPWRCCWRSPSAAGSRSCASSRPDPWCCSRAPSVRWPASSARWCRCWPVTCPPGR